MRIALAQLNYTIGDFAGNSEKILACISKAVSEKCSLIVFAELAICGYPPLDFLDYRDFITRCIDSINKIASHCTEITAIVGGPAQNPDINGKNIFNSAYILSGGRIQHIVSKSLLPTYDVFDEYRWFESNKTFQCIKITDQKVALTVCEDLWNMDADPLYTNWPMDELIREKPSLMINIAASPYNYAHASGRKSILEKNIKQYRLPLLYVNHVGAQTDIIFDGGSLIYNSRAELVHEGNYFEEDFIVCEFNGTDPVVKSQSAPAPSGKEESVYKALVLGIRDYFSKMGFKKAIIGLSGGIDSTIVTVLAAHALGSENVHAVMMPSGFSTGHSVTDSEQLIKNTGISSELLSIEPLYNAFLKTLENDFRDLPFSVAEENIQARIRGVLLMALSNKFGYILLNTSNKSELAVGYGTLYGDMAGGLSVIGDVYKSEVYALCNYINREKEIIPRNILTKPPSAELRPGQKDSDSLPPYDLLDSILLLYIENALSASEIINLGFAPEMVNKIVAMVNANEYKRFQAPPVLRISPKAFGTGRRMPLVARYT